MKVEIMYFGRPSDFLMVTSERINIQNGVYTLEKMLDGLRKRGNSWAYELDQNHVICTVNRKAATGSDTLSVGDEIGIFSSKSLFAI